MKVGTPYIVTKESDDGSLLVGDQIMLLADGSPENIQPAAKALISTSLWIVSMGNGMWFAAWEGDPGRTCIRSSAKLYRNKRKAQRAIEKAVSLYPGRNASKWRAEKVVLSEAPHEAGD